MNGPRQPQVTAALTWGGLLLLTYLLYLVVRPFLIPLGWACVLAVIIHPAHARMVPHVGRSRAAAATTLLAALGLIVPAILLVIAFAREMVSIGTTLQDAYADGRVEWIQRGWDGLVARVPLLAGIDLTAVLADASRRAAAFLLAQSGALLTNIALFFVDLVLALFAAFFLLRDSDLLMRALRRGLPMSSGMRETFIRRTADLITAGVTSSAMVAGLQGLLGGLAFAIVGLPAALFWGVVMAFACLLPFGAWVIYLPAAALLVAGGSVGKGLLLAGLGVGVVSMVDNIVRPLLLSERVRINGLVIFVSLLGGLSVFGLLGLVLGPIIVVTALALADSYIESVPDEPATTR